MAEKTAEDKSKEEILVEVYSKKDQDFDLTVEALQDILLSDEFTTVHDGFLEQNYHHFEDTEENKHIYMDIYKAYTDTIERHIEDALMDRLPGFKMSDFLRSLEYVLSHHHHCHFPHTSTHHHCHFPHTSTHHHCHFPHTSTHHLCYLSNL
jgi:hypothetical protein